MKVVVSGMGESCPQKNARLTRWCRKTLVFPVRRVWCVVSSPVKARKKGKGLVKLHNEVQTCGYEDVQVMWEMLGRSEMTHHSTKGNSDNNKQQRPFWKFILGRSN